MAGGVSAYAAINARVRVMYSYLLDHANLAPLSEAPDLFSLVEQLKHTAYADELEAIKERDLTAPPVIQALKRRLAGAYSAVIHAAPDHARRVLRQLYRRYEISNLKAIFRGLATGASADEEIALWDRVRPLLFPFGPATVIPAQQMLEAGSVAAGAEFLRGTPYYEVVSFALKRYSAEKSLFPVEVALDLYYWRTLWQEARKLPPQEQGPALRVIGSLIDTNNLMWIIRYRTYQDLSEEELINYTLPFGYRVRDEDIRAVAAGGAVESVLTRLYPDVADLSTLLQDPRQGLPTVERELTRHVMKQCAAAFVGNPFQIGVPLAYLVLHDLEIQDLVVLVEAKASDLSSDEFGPFLLKDLAVRT